MVVVVIDKRPHITSWQHLGQMLELVNSYIRKCIDLKSENLAFFELPASKWPYTTDTSNLCSTLEPITSTPQHHLDPCFIFITTLLWGLELVAPSEPGRQLTKSSPFSGAAPFSIHFNHQTPVTRNIGPSVWNLPHKNKARGRWCASHGRITVRIQAGDDGGSLLRGHNQLLRINRFYAINLRPPLIPPTVSHLVLLVSVLVGGLGSCWLFMTNPLFRGGPVRSEDVCHKVLTHPFNQLTLFKHSFAVQKKKNW